MAEIPKKIELAEPLEHGETRVITLDDGTEEEVYISKVGNIVTPPSERNKNQDFSRRQLCWDYYVKSWRSGNPNAKAAALKAGFSENTAINIGNQKWFKEKKDKLRRSTMMSNAERNYSRILNLPWTRMKLVEVGKDDGGKPIMEKQEEVDIDTLRVVEAASKTVLTTLGKDEGYSTKTELKGEMQGEIKINSISYADQVPIEVENQIAEESIKQIENQIIKDVIVKEE